MAQPETEPTTGVPLVGEAHNQSRVGDVWTLSGDVVIHYRGYILRADRVTYHWSTTVLEAEGHLQLTGGPNDLFVEASHGDMRLNMHTARFYDVHGSQGIRSAGRSTVYTSLNPLLFSGRVLIQTGEGSYRIVDGRMTNCRLPKPDWELISRSIQLSDGTASTANTVFKFLGVPLFYLPYLRHPVESTGRESGLLLPVISTGSSIRGYTFGEQVYVVLGRSMDMVIGSEYYSKRGWAPNGDFRYKGPGLDHLTVKWNSLLDRGVKQTVTDPVTGEQSTQLVNQGGIEISAVGRKELSPRTYVAGNIDYLSSYIYRLVFNDNYSQAVSSQVQSNISLTHVYNGFVSSASLDRFQGFASSAKGDEVRILHLPSLRFEALDQPLGASRLYWGMGSSLDYLGRSEFDFHARNVVRLDIYPHLSLPLEAGGWSLLTEAALRSTGYTISQNPDLAGTKSGVPTISHDSLERADVEVSVSLRPPAVERDFALGGGGRVLRHVVEPELTYRYVTGIGEKARNVLLFDTTDLATDTNEAGYSLTQRFYLRPGKAKPCATEVEGTPEPCAAQEREWASWQIAQRYFIDPQFGGALIQDRRNVFDSTLDLSGVAFLVSPRNLSPVTSRLRFEAISNLRVQWDLDYDPKAGQLTADNVFAGYSRGRTTVGLGHALLNAVDEKGSAASTIRSQLVQPFLSIGKPTGSGFNVAANGGYDLVHGSLQYAGIETAYNWNCCGLRVGYRRFELGSQRNETQYLYSFTLANFGSVGDIRRSNTVFRDASQPPLY